MGQAVENKIAAAEKHRAQHGQRAAGTPTQSEFALKGPPQMVSLGLQEAARKRIAEAERQDPRRDGQLASWSVSLPKGMKAVPQQNSLGIRSAAMRRTGAAATVFEPRNRVS